MAIPISFPIPCPLHPEVGGGVTPTFLSASSEAFLPRGPRGRETSQPAGWKAGVTDNSWMHRFLPTYLELDSETFPALLCANVSMYRSLPILA